MLIVGLVLLIPLIAMQFTSEVSWSWIDFLIAGVILYTFLFILHLLWIRFKSTSSRLIACLVTIVLFVLLWAELAVGVFGSPFAGH